MSKKRQLVDQILADLNQELSAAIQAGKAAHEAATHEESKPEDSHDTRGLEASYLAGAQAARIEVLRKTIVQFQFMGLKEFASDAAIAVGALIELECDGKRLHYFLVAQGGGMTVKRPDELIQVIAVQSPLGSELLGRRVGESFEVEGHKQVREYRVRAVS